MIRPSSRQGINQLSRPRHHEHGLLLPCPCTYYAEGGFGATGIDGEGGAPGIVGALGIPGERDILGAEGISGEPGGDGAVAASADSNLQKGHFLGRTPCTEFTLFPQLGHSTPMLISAGLKHMVHSFPLAKAVMRRHCRHSLFTTVKISTHGQERQSDADHLSSRRIA